MGKVVQIGWVNHSTSGRLPRTHAGRGKGVYTSQQQWQNSNRKLHDSVMYVFLLMKSKIKLFLKLFLFRYANKLALTEGSNSSYLRYADNNSSIAVKAR
mmetsp:Transcript_1449/g.3343  ORF Transcript_1449/g.3343 Transcript_1449/m.3343 type:complete len:99 (-) Transcript_1449:38-334(-)